MRLFRAEIGCQVFDDQLQLGFCSRGAHGGHVFHHGSPLGARAAIGSPNAKIVTDAADAFVFAFPLDV